jgi:hypothetical protein
VPVLLALVPGALVSGVGSYAAGDGVAARRILALKGIGLGALTLGGGTLFATGASRRTTALAMPFVLGGASLFLSSWIADIYAAANGGARAVAPPRTLPAVELAVGYAHVRDPQFAYAQFALLEATLGGHDWRVRPSAWLGLDDDTQRLRAELVHRWAGPRPGASESRDGSYAEVETAATYHRLGDERVAVATGEVAARGRLDMGRVADALAGSFFELALGVGLEIYRFDGAVDVADLPLAEFAYGMYLGRAGSTQGELAVYYDHRHDDYAGGLGTGAQFDGPYGHVGLGATLWIDARWGARAAVEAGSAHVARLELVIRP